MCKILDKIKFSQKKELKVLPTQPLKATLHFCRMGISFIIIIQKRRTIKNQKLKFDIIKSTYFYLN